ncbi:MAG: peptidoglycan DD-metalloendopeptidase family protein [Proteobacteria bacterium]|nr:peptidoglycan DD-metalloendopeptidase family protein [Pseudomonadota bacterium]MCL2308047.1 peptidoglycan DD-metalloendopeptidase family protein [Pseudomonadota bacterium]
MQKITDYILAEGKPFWVALQRRLRQFASAPVLVLALGFSAMAAFAFVPDAAPVPHPTTTLERALQLPSDWVHLDGLRDLPYWHEERVQRGDTIGIVLSRAGMRDPQAMTFLLSDAQARPLYKLRPGRALRVALDGDGQLQELRFLVSETELFTMVREGGTLRTETITPEREVRREQRAGEIQSSLFGAADAAGIPDAVTVEMANVLSGSINFYHDLRKGDHFVVYYERVYVEGELINSGRILAVEFFNGGIEYSAYWWQSPDGKSGGYYNAKGESNKRAFLRTPLEFSRVSSGFSSSRLHPVYKTQRAHVGTDFAAATGTPVWAASDGTVDFVGTQGGYGKLVILRHAGKITTHYGHLSRFASGLKKGDRVAQGKVIGYVGMTGVATGPHLHYEFRVSGVPHNPMKMVMPPAEPIAAKDRKAFEESLASTKPLLEMARETPIQKVAMFH